MSPEKSNLSARRRRKLAAMPRDRICPSCGRYRFHSRCWHVPKHGDAICVGCARMRSAGGEVSAWLRVAPRRKLVVRADDARIARQKSGVALHSVAAILERSVPTAYRFESLYHVTCVTPSQSKRLRQLIGVKARVVHEWELTNLEGARLASEIGQRALMHIIGVSYPRYMALAQRQAYATEDEAHALVKFLTVKGVRVEGAPASWYDPT